MTFGIWHSSWWTSGLDEPITFASFEEAYAAAGKLNEEWPEEHWDARELAMEPWKRTADRACPCLHTIPCTPRCSCYEPASSEGCLRCCSYGSPEQQEARAKFLAEVIDFERWKHAKETETPDRCRTCGDPATQWDYDQLMAFCDRHVQQADFTVPLEDRHAKRKGQ